MKQRRVGTFTLGLTLIFVGVLVPISLVYKEQALYLLNFLPLVLVALGIEILIYALKIKEEKLRYDGLSIFFSIAITFVAISAAGVGNVIDRAAAVSEVNKARYDAVYDIARENDLICENVWSYNDFNDWYLLTGRTIINDNRVELSANLSCDKSDTQKQLAKKLSSFAKQVFDSDSNIRSLYISMYGDFEDIEPDAENGYLDLGINLHRSNLDKLDEAYFENEIGRSIAFDRIVVDYSEYESSDGEYVYEY